MEVFSGRIERVQSRMQPDSVLVMPPVQAAIRNRDTHYPYRAHSDMLYLTGVNEEELGLMLTHEEIHVFAQTRNPERERWVGRVKGHDFFTARLGAAKAKIIAHEPHEFEKYFNEAVKGKRVLYYDFGVNAETDRRFFSVLNELANFSRRGVSAPRTIVRASELIHECRLFKDAYDLDCMRKAAKISAAAHNLATDRIATATGPVTEFEIKAAIEHEFMRQGADRLAYPSIVAAGANATVLHYEGTTGTAAPGDFILIDAGSEFEGYASDITRTTAVGGLKNTTGLRRDLYTLVLAAQKSALAQVKTGNSVESVHAAAIDVLSQGLLDMGFFNKVPQRKKNEKSDPAVFTKVTSLAEVKELEYYSYFYMHKTSHYLGLDVHDVGDYFQNGESRALAPGMVITVEPGLYFPEEYDFIGAEARGIGIRIEDDVLVTDNGNEVLTAACKS